MRKNSLLILGLTVSLAVGVAAVSVGLEQTDPAVESTSDAPATAADEATEAPAEATEKIDEPAEKPSEETANSEEPAKEERVAIQPATIAPFVEKGMKWLVQAQHESGGWGGGSHSAQNIRDPHKVQTDPATTAFTLLSFLRAGHSPVDGQYKEAVLKATEYLLRAVEEADEEGPKITSLTGTQPQTKLGPFVDTALTAQYLGRILPLVEQNEQLHARVDKALDKCLAKLQKTQQKDGSWGKAGGWAPVLQSALGCAALEVAQANGKEIDGAKLEKARDYLSSNINEEGRANADAAAGVELYAFGGGQRANASRARQAEEAIDQAKKEGKLDEDAETNEENLRLAGVDAKAAKPLAEAAAQNQAQLGRFDDEALLKGFGNNGGEEYLSYLMTSESLVIAGGDKFHKWNDKMHGRLKKVQNQDGSWSGHHCITSPVFCTAAVVQCLTTDRDVEFLVAMAKKQQDVAKVAQAQ